MTNGVNMIVWRPTTIAWARSCRSLPKTTLRSLPKPPPVRKPSHRAWRIAISMQNGVKMIVSTSTTIAWVKSYFNVKI